MKLDGILSDGGYTVMMGEGDRAYSHRVSNPGPLACEASVITATPELLRRPATTGILLNSLFILSGVNVQYSALGRASAELASRILYSFTYIEQKSL